MDGFFYEQYDGLGLAELVKNKEIHPKELVEEAIVAIESLNPSLNAVVHTMYEQAGKAAEENMDGMFAGVPVLLKNITGQEIKDEPLTSGSKAFQSYKPKADSMYVQKLKGAGAVFLGQTNVPEFGLMAVTEPDFYGPSKNPWSTGLTPGGSSGGAAAAVASGMVPIAGASDGGGSIRIPAAYCGLFGLKPTRGRTPVGPKQGRSWQGAAVDHVLTRSVRDSAAMLDVLHIFEKTAAYHAPPFKGNYLELVSIPLEKQCRIAFSVTSPIGTDVHPECKRAVLKTAALLEAMGHIVEEKDAPVNGKIIANSYLTMYFGEVAATMASLEEVLGRKPVFTDVEPTTWLLSLLGKVTTAGEFVRAIQEWDKAAYSMEAFHETYDFYVTPTNAFPPLKIGELQPTVFEKAMMNVAGRLKLGGSLKKAGIVDQIAEKNLAKTPFTQLANLTGQPAMTVPVHETSDGLPIGVQVMAARGREDLLYQLAGMLEQTSEWINVRQNPAFRKSM